MGLFKSYMTDIWRDCRTQIPMACVLVALGAVVEGIGIVAILPFLAIILDGSGTPQAAYILGYLEQAGLETALSQAWAMAAVVIAILCLRGWIVWKRDVSLHLLGQSYVDRWRVRLLSAIGQADWLTVSGHRRSDIEHALTNDVSRLAAGTAQLLRSAAAIAISAVQLAIIAVLSPVLLAMVMVMVLFGLALLLTVPLMRRASTLGHQLTRSGRQIYGVLGDFMTGQKLARLHNAEADFTGRFTQAVDTVRHNQNRFVSSQSAARGWFQIAAGAVVMAAFLIGYFLLETPVSILAVMLLVLARLAGPLQMIAATGQMIANTLPAFEALVVLRETLMRSHAAPGSSAAFEGRTGPAGLALERIGFTYPGGSDPVLGDVSLTLEPGEILAITGASGSGKTTLLDIISGLIQPDNGQVHLDGVLASNEATRRAWRDQIAYLPQDPLLFDTSLRDNLVWGTCMPDEAAIAAALEAACATHIIDQRNGGLAARAGERGQALSGGERQRLCLARALLRQPRLLILDEATNALDSTTEKAVLGNLGSMRSAFSLILVTHRQETLRFADRVVHIHQGRILAP